MQEVLKKCLQKFRKVKDEMKRWDELQLKLLSQFRNASSIIERLQIIQNPNNYGILKCIDGIQEKVVRKQMESLEIIFLSMNKTLEEFHGIVLFLEKSLRDTGQLLKGGSAEKLQKRIGIKPSLADCLDGLSILHEMHQSEYLLKSSTVSALPKLVLKPRLYSPEIYLLDLYLCSPTDLAALHQLLVDQPNIPIEKVESIFNKVFAEEIC